VLKSKWSFQEDALEKFLEERNGILEMATGTGKTRTSMKIIKSLISSRKISSVIISTPSNKDLAEQWYNELITYSFGIKSLAFRNFSSYNEMSTFLNQVRNSKDERFYILILFQNKLHELIAKDKKNVISDSILIADEVHNLGSPGNVKKLSGRLSIFPYRLGLSATPIREYDKEGNNFIEDEIGKTFFEFDLKKAIQHGVLCRFDYHPIPYQLSDEEVDKIAKYIRRGEARKKAGENPLDVDRETALLVSKVKKLSVEKIPLFREYITKNPSILERCIVFVYTREYGKDIQKIIWDLNRNYHTYYAEDNKQELEGFSKGELDLLLTCHKISEGIDIKTVRNVILLYSDRARLETIQRIGRCLRSDTDNPEKKALVLDFVLKNEMNDNKTSDGKRYEWLMDVSKTKRGNERHTS